MRKIVFAVAMSLFFVLQAFADVTGAGDAAITLQLTKIYATLVSKYGSTGTGVVSFHNFSNYSQYFSD